jgi:integrase
MKSSLSKKVVNSSGVTAQLIESLRKDKVMTSKAEKLLEDLSREIIKGKAKRTNVKFYTLIRKYRPTASERDRSIIREHIIKPGLGEKTITQLDIPAFIGSHLDKPMSSAKKIFGCFERIMQLHDETFTLPKVKYRNHGKKWGTEHILTDEQIQTVIGRVHEPYQPLCWIAVYTALRLGNVVNLRPCDICFEEGFIDVKQTKTGRPVSVPISEPLRALLLGLKCWPLNPEERVFPQCNAKAVSTSVRRAFHREGISWGSFHHFRHYAACKLINEGVPLEVVRDILGHADFRSTLTYARIKKEKLQEAVRAVKW